MPTKNKRLFGLIGFPLGHSFSKRYFTEKFEKEGLINCGFELFPIESINEIPNLIRQHPNLEGLSVTIPYKEKVMPFLQEIDDAAKEIGAVNCVRIREGRLKGYNTDAYGFELSLIDFINFEKLKTPGAKMPNAIILGTGGASKAVAYVLRKLEIPYTHVSRKRETGRLMYADLTHQIMSTIGLIVNTTPLGTFPHVESCPDIPYEFLDGRQFVYDLVYNPERTSLMEKAESKGCRTHNGETMFLLQAEKAWTIWNE